MARTPKGEEFLDKARELLSKSLFSILKMYYNSSYRHEGAKSE